MAKNRKGPPFVFSFVTHIQCLRTHLFNTIPGHFLVNEFLCQIAYWWQTVLFLKSFPVELLLFLVTKILLEKDDCLGGEEKNPFFHSIAELQETVYLNQLPVIRVLLLTVPKSNLIGAIVIALATNCISFHLNYSKWSSNPLTFHRFKDECLSITLLYYQNLLF